MSTITSIKQQKNKNRVNVYLDDKFGFGIDLENFVKLNLRIEQELTEDEIEKIIRKAEFQKTLNKLLKFATLRPRSEKEIRDWFYRKKVPEVIQKDLFSKLKYFDLLGDEKFAALWVENRQAFSPKSKRVLEFELKKKGIDREIIKKVLEETVIDENKLAIDLLAKRNLTDDKKKLGYLMRKGFSFEIAKKAIKSYN